MNHRNDAPASEHSIAAHADQTLDEDFTHVRHAPALRGLGTIAAPVPLAPGQTPADFGRGAVVSSSTHDVMIEPPGRRGNAAPDGTPVALFTGASLGPAWHLRVRRRDGAAITERSHLGAIVRRFMPDCFGFEIFGHSERRLGTSSTAHVFCYAGDSAARLVRTLSQSCSIARKSRRADEVDEVVAPEPVGVRYGAIPLPERATWQEVQSLKTRLAGDVEGFAVMLPAEPDALLAARVTRRLFVLRDRTLRLGMGAWLDQGGPAELDWPGGAGVPAHTSAIA